jgi:hypothetical protein
MNVQYGKYGPRHGEAPVDEVTLYWSWWASQLATWSACVGLSRVFSGLIVIASFRSVRASDNIALAIAVSITNWDVSCAVKQWAVAGLLRVFMDIGQIAVIDIVNRLDTHYRTTYHRL